MKRIILFLLVLVLADIPMADGMYYSLDLNYYDGAITFRGINLLSGTAPETGDRGAYTLRLVSFYNMGLGEWKFDVGENEDFTLYAPYYNEAKEVVIFKDGERIFGYDVSSFADVCGDGSCQFHESYENCPEDCPSGLKDDFCDMVEEGECDPDCGVGVDPDCEEEFVVETKDPKPEIKEGLREEPVRVEKEAKENKISLMYYIIPSLVVILIIIGLGIFGRNKTREQNEERLRKYIDNNLKMGYAPERIRSVLLNQGYKEKEVDKFF